MTEPRAHGGLLDRELEALGLDACDVLDVSVNVNPYGPSPAVVRAIRAAPIDRYPDPTAWGARRAIAAAIGDRAERVVLGNGAVDLLWTLARVLLPAGAAAAVVEPAFSEFGAAALAAGGRVVAWRAREADGFAIDFDAVGEVVRRSDAGVLYLANPANPTGVAVATADVAAFARAHPAVTVVLDESFLALSDAYAEERAPVPENVVRVRSMTKTHALPGVRVGYMVAREDLAAAVERARPPWSTSALAQAAAVAAVKNAARVDAAREQILADRRRQIASLLHNRVASLPTSTLYFLVPVEDAPAARAELLARHRVLVRDATSFGLPGWIRVCARPRADEDRLVTALREVVAR